MKTHAFNRRLIAHVVLIVAMMVGTLVVPAGFVQAAGTVSLATLGSAYTQNFDTLSNTAGSTTNTLTIPGWDMTETGGGARDNEQYAVDNGGSTTGDTYSYGAAASTDRALGSLRSGTLIPIIGAAFTNNTGSTIGSLNIAYTGEQWRLGTAARTDQINFDYSTDATDLTTGTWTNIAALNFVTPDTATAGAKNGNVAADRTALAASITGVSIPNGATFWIRWTDLDATGADDALGVDDFSITPNGAVATPNLSINDVSLNEGNAGTTSFTFTASLSAPAGPGGVTFDIATADGTAVAPGDYTAKSLTSQTIPAGSSTYSFTVLGNGDITPETNKTFFVNVTNVTGATLTDGQGQGTLVNDDAAPNLTINDVALNEGNAGTTTFNFTVSLSAPAGAGGVTFDIATANGTAVAPGDYTAKSLTAQTIPAGSSTYSFGVLINGDPIPEPDETFFVNVTNVTNAIVVDSQGLGTVINDDLSKIHDVQGNGAATPIPGATVTVEGVVVANFQGTNKLQGFFLQEEDADADADPATSEGILIFCGSCPTAVAEGQRVRATGSVAEFNNMTEITASSAGSVVVTDAGNHLAEVTPAPIDLPIAGDIDMFYEAREGMLVTFVDTLTVADYFELARFGQIELYEGGRPQQFTDTSAPSVAGYAAHLDSLARRHVILDDDNNAQEAYLSQPDGSQFIYYPRANGGFSVGTQGTDFFRGGDLVNGLTGVLHWSFPGFGADTWRIRPTAARPANFTVANPRPATPPAVGGAIKAVGMNLLNYFTTIDTTASTSAGPCGPSGTLDCRGADSVAELNRQRERASVVICSLNADVYAFMELENTTPSATITDLLGAVNARCGGAHPYTFVNTGGTLGTDAIRVMQIYRTGILSPVGAPLVDLDPVHNRPPTAQTFDVVDAANPAFGQRFTVIANHFKSKGCPGTGGDADAGDGQGCFNATRTAQATRLLAWINGTVLPAAGDPDILLLGDFNSYAQENPVTTLTSGGYTDLASSILGPSSYSYLFDGQLGHLDYAFANPSFAAQITGIGDWHINADEVPLFDYDDEVKDTGEAAFEEKPDGSALVPPRVVFQPGTPYRASDHDPVIVGLFQVADVAVTKVDTPDPVTAGDNLSYTITVANTGPDAAASVSLADTLPAGTTFVSLASPAGWSCTTPAVGAGGTISCSSVSMPVGSATFTLVVAVDAALSGGTILSNTASATSATSDPTPGNNSATATTTVNALILPMVTNVSSTAADGAYTTGALIPVTITFSAVVNVTGTPQLTLETGTTDAVVNYTSGSGTTTLTFNYTVQPGDTSADLDYLNTLALALNGGTINDAAAHTAILTLPAPGTAGSLGANNTLVIDTTAPTVSMSSVATNPTNSSPIAVVVTFSEPVTGFTASDIVAGNGAVSNVAGSGASYSFDLTPVTEGLVTADIAASVATDAAGNDNTAATQFSRTSDTVRPSVTINQAAGQADPTSSTPVSFQVVFSEAVTGFSDTDITLSGTANPTTAVVTGGPTSYTVAVSGMNASGTVIASIAANVASDAAGNANVAATSTDNTVTYVPSAPPVITEGASITVTMSVNSTPTPFALTLHASDSNADPLTWRILTPATSGTAGVGATTGVVTYTPATNYRGTDSFMVEVADGNGGTASITVHVIIAATRYTLFLPFVARAGAPDLVVSVGITPNKQQFSAGEPVTIQVTVTNNGSATADPFWVDLYLNPSSPPTAANQVWNTRCSLTPCFGMAWQVTTGLAAGQSITLSSQSPTAGYAIWPGWFAAGTTDLYVFADSYNPGVAAGAVAELDESNNRAELHGLNVTGANPVQAQLATLDQLRQRPPPTAK